MSAEQQVGDILDREFWCPACRRFTPWVVISLPTASEDAWAKCVECGHR